jgi:hypothetical protein
LQKVLSEHASKLFAFLQGFYAIILAINLYYECTINSGFYGKRSAECELGNHEEGLEEIRSLVSDCSWYLCWVRGSLYRTQFRDYHSEFR